MLHTNGAFPMSNTEKERVFTVYTEPSVRRGGVRKPPLTGHGVFPMQVVLHFFKND